MNIEDKLPKGTLSELEKERDDQLRLFANWIHDKGYEPTFVENVWCNMGNEKYFQTEQLVEQFKASK